MSAVEDARLAEALVDLAKVKEQIANFTEEKTQIEEVIIKSMQALGKRTISANNGDLRGTLVEPTTITIDSDGLKKVLTAAQWKKVTKQVLDKERLEAEITVGNIDPTVVASVSTEKDIKPSIRLSGTFRSKKGTPPVKKAVSTRNSSGGTKPAAKKRVVKPKKTT